jgi:hypothetical protein
MRGGWGRHIDAVRCGIHSPGKLMPAFQGIGGIAFGGSRLRLETPQVERLPTNPTARPSVAPLHSWLIYISGLQVRQIVGIAIRSSFWTRSPSWSSIILVTVRLSPCLAPTAPGTDRHCDTPTPLHAPRARIPFFTRAFWWDMWPPKTPAFRAERASVSA